MVYRKNIFTFEKTHTMKNLTIIIAILFGFSGISKAQDYKSKKYRTINSKKSKIANVITVIYQDNGLATFSRSEAKAEKNDAIGFLIDVPDGKIKEKTTSSEMKFEFQNSQNVWVIPMENPSKFYNLGNTPKEEVKYEFPLVFIEAKALRFNSGN